MKKISENPRRSPARAARTDGDATRQQILEVAGKVFAEFGYDAATSKQVCLQAGVNVAAVNYHFSGKDGLYSAVLTEAHRRLLSLEDLAVIAGSQMDARSKLERVIDGLIDGMDTDGWHLRVYLREVINPSPLFGVLLDNQVVPKLSILRNLLGQVTGLAPDDPSLAHCFLATFAPCIVLLIANRNALSRAILSVSEDKHTLKEHLKTFALAGCDAISREKRKR
ncbi:MAG: CerR family C-terminal domain-containing protein [Glaciimonas sp.]|nr:CerR family C-terminal domain-containing protein [Glaciimonas sp.]